MAAERVIPSNTPTRALQDHQNSITAVAVFLDRCRIVTGSLDKTLRLWDLKDGVVLKKMEGHRGGVRAVAVSQDGQFIASGDDKGGLIAWDGKTGELTKVIEAHSDEIRSLDFSPDSEVLASTGSTSDKSTKMWSTETWQPEGKPIYTLHDVYCARYSPSGELLVITTTFGATIYDPFTSDCMASFSGDTGYKFLTVLAWTPDGGRLLSGGSDSDRAIREWDPSTWQQLGDPWNGHTNSINAIAVSPNGTLVASASADKHVRLWRLSDQRTIAMFKHTKRVNCVTFSADGRHILSGGDDMKISEWAVPEDALQMDPLKDQASTGILDASQQDSGILGTVTSTPPAQVVDNIDTRLPTDSMDEDNGGPRKTSWTLLKRSHSNPHLLDERVLNEGSRRGSIRLVREAEFSRSAGHSPNHEPPFTSSSTWSLISDQTDVVMTSDRRPILKPIEPQDGLASPHSDTDDTYLSISMHPAQDLGMVVDESDEFTASLRPLLKYTEGDHLDLQGISSFLSSPDPNLQCAALQMLERAAEWESTNFTECMPVTFGPVSDLLNSQNLQVHCAALDTLKFFLASPHAADTIQSMITRVANAVFNDLSSSEPLVQMGSVELLEAAAQSEEILVEFTAAISHISSVLPSMPTATQVSALGVLEVSAGSNSHDLVKAVADTCQSFTQALFSPKTTVQIAVLEVLEAGLGTKSKELYHAVTAVLPVLANIISSGDPDVQTVARRVLEAGTRPVALNLWSTDSPLLPQPSALQHSQGQLPGQEYGLLSQATVRGAGALPGEFPHLYVERNHKLTRRGTQSPAPPGEVHGPLSQESVGVTGNTPTERTNTPFGQLSSGLSFNTSGSVTYGLDVLPFHSFAPQYEDLEGPALYAPTVLYDYVQDSGIPDKVVSAPSAQVIDDVVPDNMRSQYVDPSKAESVIREVIYAQFENAPLRLLDTITGLLCDREAQISVFKASSEYKELLSFTMQHADLRLMMGRIKEVVETHFRCVMLSHRWEGKEPLPHDVRDRAVYGLKAVGSITKLQSFCRVARDAGYRWAWMDTCCIDQTNNVEVQESVNSMFVWYRHSALTIVYLSDVPPSSKSGALARSAWNSRGWTVQEFLAPKVVLFYQEDWTLYLGDCSSNHKDSVTIMRELGDATGIDARSLVAFHPGMKGAREKLRWVSTRITTLQEDIAYSLFGIFDVHLPVIYGEKKQNALGRLLQEVVARSGDISVLDWVGKSSNFNSCLPADITLYKAPACTLPSSSEDEMQASASSLRDAGAAKWASRLYHTLNTLRAPRFAHCRLHLPCIAFLVTDVRRKRGQDLEMNYTYKVKADGLHDLVITTEDRLPQFSQTRPTRPAFLIVRPWDRSLLKLPDFADLTDVSDAESIEDWSPSVSPVHDSPGEPFGGNQHIDSESHSQALRLIVRLGQRFSAFFLAQQWGGEYKRIASDHDIVAQVKDIASVHDMMNVRTLEIL